MVDLLPTLVTLAGGTVDASLDGVDQWSSLSKGLPSPRTFLVYNIDDVFVPSLLAGPVIYQKFQVSSQTPGSLLPALQISHFNPEQSK